MQPCIALVLRLVNKVEVPAHEPMPGTRGLETDEFSEERVLVFTEGRSIHRSKPPWMRATIEGLQVY
jgi:hypothetical protein